MKTLVVFYSRTGHCKALAQARAEKESADLAEIEDAVHPKGPKDYSEACTLAIGGKPWPIKPVQADLPAYGRIALYSPVWAANTPPAVNAFLDLLPAGMPVAAVMVSASGMSGCEPRLAAALQARGGNLESFEEVRGA